MDTDFAMDFSGPLFDNRALEALVDYRDAIEYDLSERGEELVLQRLGHVLRHPTGRYESHVKDRAFRNARQVWDEKSVYGPWLEGTGSRNSTTRFKGYRTFRQSTQQLERESLRIAEQTLRPYLIRMGGEST